MSPRRNRRNADRDAVPVPSPRQSGGRVKPDAAKPEMPAMGSPRIKSAKLSGIGWRDGGAFDATLSREALDMTNGSGERLDRVERILEELAKSQDRVAKSQEQFQEWVTKSHREMAARQQYHDEAFERHAAAIKGILEAIAVDSENIRALARIAELHNQRLEGLEGGESA